MTVCDLVHGGYQSCLHLGRMFCGFKQFVINVSSFIKSLSTYSLPRQQIFMYPFFFFFSPQDCSNSRKRTEKEVLSTAVAIA